MMPVLFYYAVIGGYYELWLASFGISTEPSAS